jgi:quaternary ammonium compound-resistance protein SugE
MGMWAYVFFAGVFEIFMAMALKSSQGFSRLYPSLLTLVTAVISFYLLSRSLKELPIGAAYAVWTGIGVAGTAIFGVLFLQESLNLWQVFFLVAIAVGIVGLKLAG